MVQASPKSRETEVQNQFLCLCRMWNVLPEDEEVHSAWRVSSRSLPSTGERRRVRHAISFSSPFFFIRVSLRLGPDCKKKKKNESPPFGPRGFPFFRDVVRQRTAPRIYFGQKLDGGWSDLFGEKKEERDEQSELQENDKCKKKKYIPSRVLSPINTSSACHFLSAATGDPHCGSDDSELSSTLIAWLQIWAGGSSRALAVLFRVMVKRV